MSAESGEEISLTAAEMRKRLRVQSGKGYRPRPIFLGTFTDGSRYMIELQGGTRYFYLVTDLTKPSTNHNLLSATHPDTSPQSPPLDPAGVIGTNGLGQWTEIDPLAGTTRNVLTADQGLPAVWNSVKLVIPFVIFHELANQASSSITVPNADTVLRTLTELTINGGTAFSIIEAQGYVSFTALSTNQSVLIKLKKNGVAIGSALVIDSAVGVVSSIPYYIKRIVAGLAVNDAFTITASAAAADANTTVFCQGLQLSSVV